MLVRRRSNPSRLRIVKHQAQTAFVFTGKLADFERAGLGRGFPVNEPTRVLRRVLANAIQLASTAAHKTQELPRDQGQQLKEIVCLEQRRVDQQVALQLDLAALEQKGE